MSYFTAQIEEERAALAAAGHVGATHHRSITQSPLPAIRLYPVAPAQGTLSSAVSAVYQAAVPGGRAISQWVSSHLPSSSSASQSRTASPSSSSSSKAMATAAATAVKAAASMAQAGVQNSLNLPPPRRAPVASAISPENVLIASSTAVMLEAFLLETGVTRDTVVLVPGLLLHPFHNLLNVLASFGATLVPFDFDVDTMEGDISAMRAALSSSSSSPSSPSPARPVMLLVGIRGRFFRNAPDMYKLAAEKYCRVVSIRTPVADSSQSRVGSTPLDANAPSIHITSFDGPGSLGGAVAYSPQPSTTAAMRTALRQLPAAGALEVWARLARHLCNVFLTNKLDYGSTVWILALISRAGRGLSQLALQAIVGGGRGRDGQSKRTEGAGAATATDAARQEAVDWMYDLFTCKEARYPVDADHSSPTRSSSSALGDAVSGAASSLLRQAAAVGSAVLASGKQEVAPPAQAESAAPTSPSVGPEQQRKGSGQRNSPLLSVAARPATGGPAAARTSTRPPPSTLEWLRKLLLHQQTQKDAELLCLWYLLYCMPSYVRVVSAGEARTPLACVEAGLSSVILRVECPALVSRQLQTKGFAALPSRPLPVSLDHVKNKKGLSSSLASVARVNGVVFFSKCKSCAAAAKQLCFVPLSPAMSPADHQLLVDLLSEMPRAWMTMSRQPVSSVTTGDYRRTDGRNFSDADRPYNTPEVRELLLAVSRPYATATADGTASNDQDTSNMDRAVKMAMKKLFKGSHPIFTYLAYGTTAARLLVAKM